MDYTRAFAISSAGMSVERTRIEVAALNLANANTIQTADGVAFQPVQVVARAGMAGVGAPSASFAEQIEQALDGEGLSAFSLPEVAVEPTGTPARQVYEPGHPFADARGYVSYPGVDTAAEMVTLMSALRAYEANVAALNAARTAALKALEIGGPA